MLTRWLYTAAFYLAIPVVLIRLYRRVRKNPAYRHRIAERFGRYQKHSQAPVLSKSIWFHTVSVGEFTAARSLIDKVMKAQPDTVLVITTMTPTGSERVMSTYHKQIEEGRVIHVYAPYDLPGAVCRFLNRFKPSLLVIMETELWPNIIHFTHQRDIPIIVANARLSAKSAEGYRKVLPLFRPMMREVSIIAAQSEQDGERFVELGLPPASLQVTGTVKFDLAIEPELEQAAKALRSEWGQQRRVLIGASTHEGEDEQLLEAFLYLRSKVEDTLLVIVPRHPERFEEVAELIRARGFKMSRVSQSDPVDDSVEVVLGDTMGDLLRMLGAADVAFVGGSLVPVGGHNMLEPLAMGTPALTGPHVFNFQVVADLLSELEVLRTITSPLGLGQATESLLKDESGRQHLAIRGRAVVEANRGAVERLFALIVQYFK